MAPRFNMYTVVGLAMLMLTFIFLSKHFIQLEYLSIFMPERFSLRTQAQGSEDHILLSPESYTKPSISEVPSDTILDLLGSLESMQKEYFLPWLGTWPDAIDWTRAVHNTQISGALSAITRHPLYRSKDSPLGEVDENTISRYFNHIISFYFGEDALSLRSQAYDDMQWVVLSWIEAAKFASLHSDLHYAATENCPSSWHGRDYVPAFAHRARIFWDLASGGWETELCGGGMIWSPYLAPYKNAITNELFIAASINMYLYFPGDNIESPFVMGETGERSPNKTTKRKQHDEEYLQASIAAYKWLLSSNMTNSQGLFTDGFHIKDWRGGNKPSNGTGKCDLRNEMVYTYNQGVVLTGQRGLWEATGQRKYLMDGHKLIQNVIAATGFDCLGKKDCNHWAGLGRNGVLEEKCDATSSCSQNGQTFKGIFFHHLSTFCEPLQVGKSGPIFHRANKKLANLHRQKCFEYAPWITRNAKAALGTRDKQGKFGGWWTIGLRDLENDTYIQIDEDSRPSTDYRNRDIPFESKWRLEGDGDDFTQNAASSKSAEKVIRDPNQRGRGRTVETQSSGLAILACLIKIVELQNHKEVVIASLLSPTEEL